MSLTYGIVIPAHNEENNIGGLLDFLRDEGHSNVIVIDDVSDDATAQIVRDRAAVWPNLRFHRNIERSGQLAGWICGARTLGCDVTVFIDADSIPQAGAVHRLVETLNDGYIASGRVEPTYPDSVASWHPIRKFASFSARILRNVRRRNTVLEAVIGRFFAVSTQWFLSVAGRTDILANDTYLSCLAFSQGMRAQYADEAVVDFTPALAANDAAAQRARADRGYNQLRSLEILRPAMETSRATYLRSLFVSGVEDPTGMLCWLSYQLEFRFQGRGETEPVSGIWTSQKTTKSAVTRR